MLHEYGKRLFDTLEQLVHEESDDYEATLKKTIVVAVALFLGITGVVWGAIYLFWDEPVAALLPWAYSVISVANILLLRWHKRYAWFRDVQQGITLLIPFVLMLILGGFANSGAVAIWCFIAPLSALLTTDTKQAFLWFAAYIVLLLIGALLEGPMAAPNDLPVYVVNAFWVLNIGGATMAAFAVLLYFLGRTDAAQEEIAELFTEAEEARKVAEAATVAKSAFLANMSHEIRTPMNAVMGMNTLLLDTKLNTEQREYAEVVRNSSDALLVIINDILDFSKIEADKLVLEDQPFDLRQCMEECLDLVAPAAANKELNLAYVMDEAVPEAIYGDATRLRQILANLLTNAVKFTAKGEIVASVEIENQEDAENSTQVADNGLLLHFRVADTGIGIAPEDAERLFESFSQVDASTTRRYGGTGLGLAISRKLTELMGGTIWVESLGIPGQGTTFHVTIRTRPAPAIQRSYLDVAQPELAGRHVLIVDDNQTNRQIIRRQVESWRMQAHETALPSEALARIEAGESFDVAILDVQMPEMDGLALAEELRRQHDVDTLPLVLLTSLGRQASDAERLTRAQVSAFLTKPIKPSQLYNELLDIFGDHPYDRSERSAGDESEFDSDMGQRYPLRVLLVEDNQTNQYLATLLLERLGYTADLATNGLEALAALEQHQYELVLMDIQMPEMDGIAATAEIRQRWPEDEQPQIVAMTADVLQEEIQFCQQAGMNGYVAKPIRVPDLIEALQSSWANIHGSDVQSSVIESSADRSTEVPLTMDATAPPADLEQVTDEEDEDVLLDPDAIARLLRVVDDNQEVLSLLIDSFLEDGPGLLDAMQRGAETQDAETLRRAAHTLKSNSADFGAMALSDLCKQLEAQVRQNHLEGTEQLVAEITDAYVPVAAALAHLKTTGADGSPDS